RSLRVERHAAEEEILSPSAPLRSASERDRVAEKGPRQTDEAERGEAHHQRVEGVFRAHHPAVEEAESGSHHQHESRCDEEPGGIGCVEGHGPTSVVFAIVSFIFVTNSNAYFRAMILDYACLDISGSVQMQREDKSERCRRQVLDAALRLFSQKGYGPASVREIAEQAGVSVGALYHHFPDKESIFRSLIDEYREITDQPRFPFYRAIRTGLFPNNLEQLGYAARDSVRQYRDYQALFFVDVIEFGGEHIRDFYAGMADRFAAFIEEQRTQGDDMGTRLRPGVSPRSALLLASRIFFNYFPMELLFGVPEPFGKSSAEMV